MRIATFTRSFRDFEEQHIERFLDSHAFCDTIYVGLCETSPKTLEILSRYANVKTKEFGHLATAPDGMTFAHEGQYYGFLDEWSRQEDVDFVLFDDADHYVNTALQRDARYLLETSQKPLAFNLLIYAWGAGQYFPKLNECNPPERLWGWNIHEWQPQLNLSPATTVEIVNQPDPRTSPAFVFPHPPYCLLHASWPSEQVVRQKMEFNIKRGVPQTYPLESCGTPELLPAWARD